jgi:ABC-2 type transport system permease protein
MRGLFKYLKYFTIGMVNNIEYRFNILTVLFFNFLPVIINFYLWKAIFLSSSIRINQLNGMTLNQVVSYIIIVQFVDLLTGTASIDFEYKIMNEIKNGDICKYILKPINYFFYNMTLNISKTIIYIIPLSLISIIIFLMFKDYIVITNSLLYIFLFVISLMIAFLIRYYISFLFGLLGFFLDEVSQLYHLVDIVLRIISGYLFPLNFLPYGLCTVSKILPFQYLGFFPSMLLIGKFAINEVVKGISISLLWIIFLFFVYRLIWKIGMKRYSAFGG